MPAVTRVGLELARERRPSSPGQPDVEHDHIGRVGAIARARLLGVGDLRERRLDQLERRAQQHAESRIVVDDEDFELAVFDA